MKLLLEIPDSKVNHFLELLKRLSFVQRITPIYNSQEDLKREVQLELDKLEEGNCPTYSLEEVDKLLEATIKKYEG